MAGLGKTLRFDFVHSAKMESICIHTKKIRQLLQKLSCWYKLNKKDTISTYSILVPNIQEETLILTLNS